MEYSNPELPEGINTSKEHPLKEFFILTDGLLGLIFIVISALILIVDNFANKIPFELENELPVSSIIKHEHAEPLPPSACEEALPSMQNTNSAAVSVPAIFRRLHALTIGFNNLYIVTAFISILIQHSRATCPL